MYIAYIATQMQARQGIASLFFVKMSADGLPFRLNYSEVPNREEEEKKEYTPESFDS